MCTDIAEVPFVDLHAQHQSLRDEIDDVIERVIRDSTFVRGPHVERFERSFADVVGVKHCVSCANGTDALFIAMKALGLSPGDEVITTAHSWIATSDTISLAGGRVVFADTDETFCIDPDQIEARITSNTKGIVVVHLYGQPAEMDRIMELAERHKLWVIEDCAQAHLAEYRGQQVGTFGHLATFSFYPGKNLGAMGDAGAIVTSDDELAKWCRLFANHGGKGRHTMEGVNSRMDGLQAAILNVKLPYLAQWTERRRAAAEYYTRRLRTAGDLVLPILFDHRHHVFHLFVVRTRLRNLLQRYLSDHGIASQINYPMALPFLPAYRQWGHAPSEFPVAGGAQDEILSLPLYPEIKRSQLDHVCRCIHSFFEDAGCRAA